MRLREVGRVVVDAGAVVNGYDAEIVVFGELKVVGAEGRPAVFNDVIVRNGKGGYVNVKFAEVCKERCTSRALGSRARRAASFSRSPGTRSRWSGRYLAA